MTKTNYSEKLKDPRWQKRRLEKLGAGCWRCEKCSSTQVTLHVHHIKYVKGREPWEYADDELQVLCATCHSAEHPDKSKRTKISRRKVASHFTMVSNSVGRDERLSYCARGILLMASTHSERWVFSIKSVQQGTSKEGQITVRKALNELKKHGYLKMKRISRDGRFSGSSWEWNFNPSQDSSQAGQLIAEEGGAL